MDLQAGHQVFFMKFLLLAALLAVGSINLNPAQAAIERDIGQVDGRLTQPRNRVALNFGIWDGGSEDGGGITFDPLGFNKAEFDGFDYSECFFTKNMHSQHVVRLPNKNGEAYFMVSNSDYIQQGIGSGIFRTPAGRLSIYKTSNLDPNTDLVTNNAGLDGKIVWEQEFTSHSPIGDWNHPGKMEVIGNLLLVSAENWAEWTQAFCGDAGEGDDRDAILFYDIRDPANPQYWGKLDTHELGQLAVQMNDTNGDGSLDTTESGLNAEEMAKRDTYSSHWSFNPWTGIPELYIGKDGKLDATEVIPVVNNASLFQAGDEWILNVANFWFRTKHVTPDIKSWQGGEAAGYAPGEFGGGGTAIYPYFTNSHGMHFYSLEQYDPPSATPPGTPDPGVKRPMWFDGGEDESNVVGGNELFRFSHVQFSPPYTSTPTNTTTELERINETFRSAPNIFRSDNDYDGVGLYVTRTGVPVIYSALQNYPLGNCTVPDQGEPCHRDRDCDWWPVSWCYVSPASENTDTIYQVRHPGNVGYGLQFIVTSIDDSGPGTLRQALSAGPEKIIIGDNLDAETILLQSPLVIFDDVEIDASGLENGITIERTGGDFFRIFEIQAGATVTMDNLTITKGYASFDGAYGGNGFGGGILNYGDLTLNNCKVYSNQSDSIGGGIAGMPFSTLVLNNTEVSSNSSAENGAGIWSIGDLVSLNYSSVKDNSIFSPTGQEGGGIYFSGGSLAIDKSTISGNNATRFGGGIYVVSPQTDITDSAVLGNVGGDVPTYGGGLYYRKNGAGTGLKISGSTFSGNRASVTGGGIYYIYSDTGLIENSTIANNTAEGAPGAGISGAGTSTALTLRHVTVAGNTVEAAAGAVPGAGIYSTPAVALTLENTLIADNVSTLGDSNLYGDDITTVGANLVEGGIAGSVPTGPLPLTSDPGLAPLADYGGFTRTLRPLPGSVAINAAVGTPLSVDQRGISRPLQGMVSDIGAVEVGEAIISVEQSPGVIQVDGVTSVVFDPAAPGGSSSHTFTIRNAGSGNVDLTDLAVTIDGPNAAAFSVTQPADTVLATGRNTDFVVTFTPTTADMHTAAIHVASSDTDNTPLVSQFDITLNGPGWTPIAGTPGLVYHLDAALHVTESGGSVIEWGDTGRNGIMFSQESVAKQPVYADGAGTGSINGHPVIRFDGDRSGAVGGIAPNADQLRHVNEDPAGICSIAVQSCTVDTDCTDIGAACCTDSDAGCTPGMCAVRTETCTQDSDCSDPGDVCQHGEQVQTLIVVARTRSFTYIDGLWGNAPDTGLRRQDSGNWSNGINGNDFSYNGGMEINRDAVDAGSSNNLSPVDTPEIIVATRGASTWFNDTRIGDYFELAPNPARPWNGDIAEIAVFDRLLTAQELQEVQSHLETKYAITPAPLIVTTSDDEDDGGLGLGTGDSLREMLNYGGIGLTINFDDSVGDTIELNGTPLTLDKNQTLDASALPNGLTISGNGLSRVFDVTGPIGGTTALRGLMITDGAANMGGAISHGPGGDVSPSGEGALLIEDSTLSNNTAYFAGGAIYHGGASSLTLINSTLSGNTSSQLGGAILNNESVISIIHTTISNNTAMSNGGGIDNYGGTVNVENSIVAGNCVGVCTATLGNDISNRDSSLVATINPGGLNLIGSNDTVEAFFTPDYYLVGDLANKVDPALVPLGDHGGLTPTMPLLPVSPAIDAVPAGVLTTDQRGLPRSDGSPDIGAVEIQSYFVTTSIDENDAGLGLGSGDSLREIIAAASPASKVTFDAGLSGQAMTLGGTHLTIDKSLFIDASGLPAGLTISGDVTGDGPTPDDSRIFEITAGQIVEMTGLTLSGGHAPGAGNDGIGGAVFSTGSDLSLTRMILSGNTASEGGGIFSFDDDIPPGTLRLNNSAVLNNTATTNGGGIRNKGSNLDINDSTIAGNVAGTGGGGGIMDQNAMNSVINNSTLSGNTAALGGGVYSTNSSMTFANSTVSGNTATNIGGGITTLNASVTLTHATIADNIAANGGGGVVVNSAAGIDATTGHSIIAGNTGAPGADIWRLNGAIISSGSNLIGDNDTVTAEFPAGSPNINDDLVGIAALLGPLGDYGGLTMTLLPLYGSPVTDAAAGGILAIDQRGVPRPQGGVSDIGSVEVVDSDGDGLGDEYENQFTFTSASLVDSDGDGLVDGAGGVVLTSTYPGGINIDGDGFVDGEQDLGTDPTVSNLGDVGPRSNPDNMIDLSDLLVLTRLVTGAIDPTPLESILGDMNSDTLLNAADILLLQQAVLNGPGP